MTDLKLDNLIYLGHMAAFYVPVQKLDKMQYGKDGKRPRQLFEEFFMANYNAYTLEISDTQGFWREHTQSQIFRDQNARYEVSFDGRDRIQGFVGFLSEMCALLQEQAIYLTMGHKSWLVLPRRSDEV